MQSLSRLFAVVVCLLALSMTTGCASIVKGTTQKVPVASNPPGADVMVDGQLRGQTPTTLELKRKNDHLLTVQKTGYRPKSIAVVKDVGGAVWGNIIAGGLIGWGVDATTGAQYNLTPKTISVDLEAEAGSAASAPANDSESTEFVQKLKNLDALKAAGQVSDEEYGKARLELFRKYMPEALPPEARGSPEAPRATGDGSAVDASESGEATPGTSKP